LFARGELGSAWLGSASYLDLSAGRPAARKRKASARRTKAPEQTLAPPPLEFGAVIVNVKWEQTGGWRGGNCARRAEEKSPAPAELARRAGSKSGSSTWRPGERLFEFAFVLTSVLFGFGPLLLLAALARRSRSPPPPPFPRVGALWRPHWRRLSNERVH